MSLVRRISGEPQSSTSRHLGGPLPSHQPSTSACQSLPTTGSSSATQIPPTTAAPDAAPAIQTLLNTDSFVGTKAIHAANSLSITKVAPATQLLLSTDSLSNIQSPFADSASVSQSHLAKNPISNTRSFAAPVAPATQLPSTSQACSTTYESVSTQASTTTQEPTTTHVPAVAHKPIATDASAITDAPAATLASTPTSTAPFVPRTLFSSARSIYDILASQIGYESPTTTNALSLTSLLFTTQAPSSNQPPSTSSSLHSIHEPSTSNAPSATHSHCASHTPLISSAIHLPPTTITPTANGALPAFANDGAPPTTNSEQPTIGKYPRLPGIQQSTQSHDATDGDTRNLDVEMDVAHMEVVMSSSDGGCRPHEPHDFITLEPSDLAIASTSQPESRTRKRKRDDGDAGGETCTVKDFNKCLLRLLECPVCLEWIEPPIAQCRRGHLVCSRCRGRLSSCPICRTAFSSVRNRAMEGVADLVRYPCYYGCGRELRLRRRSAHEANCVARRYRCPAPACAQRAPLPLTELLEHLQKEHTSLVKTGTRHKFSMRMNTIQHDTWLVLIGRELFHLRIDVDIRSWGVVVYVAYIGPKCKANHFTYQVTVVGQNSERKLVYSRVTHCDLENSSLNVSRQDCFHLALDQALNFLRMKNKHCEPDKFLDFVVEINNRDMSETTSEDTQEIVTF